MKLTTKLLLGVTIASTTTLGAVHLANTIAPAFRQCEQLLPDADHDHTTLIETFSLDYEGATGAWYYPDDSIFGYATYEDSIIYNRPGCTPTYISDLR